MRIVVFSDLYPPLFIGGYEVGAALVVQELRRRGHEVLLLSAREYFLQQDGDFLHRRPVAGAPAVLDAGLCVFGSLPRLFRTHPVRFIRCTAATWASRRRYRRAVAAFRPERVLLFNPLAVVAPVMHDLAELAHEAGAEVHAYISDDWLAKWPAPHPVLRPLDRMRNAPGRATRLAGAALSALLGWTGWAPSEPPRFDRLVYCSEAVRRLSPGRTWSAASEEVVPWGLAGMERLPQPAPGRFRDAAPLTLLLAGQIQEHKGLAVLLRALAGCKREHALVVLGDDGTPCAWDCKRLATKLNLTQRVRFVGKTSHAETLTRLGNLGHVLVVPSIGEEPFGFVVVEGMALGLPVVASACGGPAELIRHGETGFLFERGRPEALTAVLDQLEQDRGLCERVGGRARRTALRDYTIERMVDRLLGEEPTGTFRQLSPAGRQPASPNQPVFAPSATGRSRPAPGYTD